MASLCAMPVGPRRPDVLTDMSPVVSAGTLTPACAAVKGPPPAAGRVTEGTAGSTDPDSDCTLAPNAPPPTDVTSPRAGDMPCSVTVHNARRTVADTKAPRRSPTLAFALGSFISASLSAPGEGRT